MHPVQVLERVVTERRHLERLHGKKPTQEFVPFGEKVLAIQKTTDLRNKPQISVRGLAWDAKQQRRVFHRERRWCVQSS